MQNFIEQVKANPKSFNNGEQALAHAAVTAQNENIDAPIFGIRLGHVVWNNQIPEITEAAKNLGIRKIYYASNQGSTLATLGLFVESGVEIGSLKKITLVSTTLEIVDGEMVEIPKTVWAMEILIPA